VQKEIESIKANIDKRNIALASNNKGLKKFLVLMTNGSFIRPFLICIIVYLGFPLSGHNIITQFFVSLLIEANSPIDPKMAAAVLSSYRIVICIISLTYVKRLKRKILYTLSLVVQLFGCTTVAVHFIYNSENQLTNIGNGFAWLPLIGMGLMYTAFGMGFGQVTVNIGSEMLPSNARGIGSGAALIISDLVKFGVVATVPTLQGFTGTGYIFLGCAGYCAFLIGFTYFFIPETLGKSLEEIEEYFRSKSSKKQEGNSTIISPKTNQSTPEQTSGSLPEIVFSTCL